MSGAGERRYWLALAGLGLALVAAVLFFYARSRDYNESAYLANLARLRELQELDAKWELDVLKAKVGTISNYDPLVDLLADLRLLQTQLERLLAGQDSELREASMRQIGGLDRAIQEKAGLIEHFKSHNAVLRNSLAFLPVAATDVRRAARTGQVDETVYDVLLASLVCNQGGSTEELAAVEAGLRRLDAVRERLPDAARARLDIFERHARTVLREHRMVDSLVRRIAAVPVAARIDDIHHRLASEQLRAAAGATRYSRSLLVFSVVLAVLLLYAIVSLIRSHRTIRRVNRKLQDANDNLEQRVRQRTQELRAAQNELVATARRAGMAEIATNVLHNVGNVLNSVNVSVGVIKGRIRDSRLPGLARAAAMLNEHGDDLGHFLIHDEKGRRLPEYLNRLVEALDAEQRDVTDEMTQLGKSIDHIKDIVATQQSYAGSSRVVDAVRIGDLVDDALRMNAGSLQRHEVIVVKEIGDFPALPLDRHRVLQILVNLIGNAKQAMDGMTGAARRLTLRVDLADGQSGRRLRICVADEGEGIAPENLGRIFAHGFTTRQGGHGFGLHSCIVAAREMGGSLIAHSEGPGHGATFTLELPVSMGADAP